MTTRTFTPEELQKSNPVFGQFSFDNHEQIVFCHDKDSGLKAIIGIHNTNLGPALGGTRIWNYQSEWEALNDVLRLSRGMTYKSAISGLDLGGGKAVIIGDSKKDKTPEMIKAFAKYVDSLSGRYITAEDVGSTTADMDLIHSITPHVTGISKELGGSGNPSPVTAYGVFMGLKAAANFKWGTDDLNGKKVFVQGIGNVGETLVKHLTENGAIVTITDINKERVEYVSQKYNTKVFTGADLFLEDMDIYSPCALGATINDDSIHKLKAQVIAGAANNQLAVEQVHGKILQDKGIVYAPDFLINAGGIINVFGEIVHYGQDEALKRTENIYNTTLEVLNDAKNKKITTLQAAMQKAEERIYKKR
ncbi:MULTISPECIES: Glu/Leu/Phe/Val dehydrogenase dimerization domain-containing protein [Myroides]|uniref:Leucine dehydrogenase n=1 Tax=Myroides albus TaxID=2562892 RepID=A0A6I3LG55_9FLAO|nr:MULTISPECIES: Glu/Leu/Phe/Val dehydrogenase dimerization domain-containing protein [Myroides]MTG96867.1 leucine dehydrogenase [Myroides albus]MVX36509.1 leucine dehydrogenase [Myroides sp. LoEW2-1]UVD78383.1 NAD-binding protein [Myroides albus]